MHSRYQLPVDKRQRQHMLAFEVSWEVLGVQACQDATDLERLGGERFLGERRRRSLLGERLDRLAERRLRLLRLLLRRSGLLALFLPLHRSHLHDVASRQHVPCQCINRPYRMSGGITPGQTRSGA